VDFEIEGEYPQFGNNDERVDAIACDLAAGFAQALKGSEPVLEDNVYTFTFKNEAGVWITPAFPKLIYVLEEDNIHEDSRYFYLTKLAAKCTARRMVPDYISEKKMREYKLSKGEVAGSGDVYTCMGCRSFLTPDRSGNGYQSYVSHAAPRLCRQ